MLYLCELKRNLSQLYAYTKVWVFKLQVMGERSNKPDNLSGLLLLYLTIYGHILMPAFFEI